METDHLLLRENLMRSPTFEEGEANLKYLEGKALEQAAAAAGSATAAGTAKTAAEAARDSANDSSINAAQSKSDAAASAVQALAAKQAAESVVADLAGVSEGAGADMVGTQFPYAFAIKRTQQDKNGDVLDARGWGVKGDGLIYSDKLQKALDDIGGYGGTLYVWGKVLLDTPIQVPEGVILRGFGWRASRLRVVGRDTHGRNSAIFGMFEGQSTVNFPSAISLEGDNAALRDLLVDCNGLNNYKVNPAYGGLNDWLIETDHVGINGVRVGGLYYRSSAAMPARTVKGAAVRNVSVWNASWGAVSINGQMMNMISGGSPNPEDLFGAIECGVYDCHFERNNSNTVQLNGVVNAEAKRNRIISPYHAGVKCYTRVRGATIEQNLVVCDDARQVSWHPQQATVAGYRETELATRSELLCVGHSDYDSEISNVTVARNKIRGNGVGVMHGVMVYGGCRDIVVDGNQIDGTVFGVSFTFPQSLSIRGNTIRSTPYTTASATAYSAADITLWPRSGEVAKTMASPYMHVVGAGNTLKGTGVSNIRISSLQRHKDLAIIPSIRFEDNDCTLDAIADYGGFPAAPVGVYDDVSGGTISLTGNRYFKNGARATYAQAYAVANHAKIFDSVEGTFTPFAKGGSTAGTATYSKQSGFYRMRDGIVSFQIDMAWSGHTGTGTMTIDGLPFATAPDALATAYTINATTLAFGAGQLIAQNGANTTAVSLLLMASDASVTNLTVDPNVAALRITGSYKAF